MSKFESLYAAFSQRTEGIVAYECCVYTDEVELLLSKSIREIILANKCLSLWSVVCK